MSISLRALRLAIAAVAILLLATPVLAGPGRDKKADKALRGALKGRSERHSVILSVKPGTRRQIRLAIEKCGGVVTKEHQLINALTVNLQGNCLDALLENQSVKSAGSDVSVTSTPVVGFSDGSSVGADPVQVFELADGIVLLHWSETVMPVESIVTIDLTNKRSVGRMFCWDGPTLDLVHIPFDSQFTILDDTPYPTE